jgi:tRNA G37 N-methylase TrmD
MEIFTKDHIKSFYNHVYKHTNINSNLCDIIHSYGYLKRLVFIDQLVKNTFCIREKCDFISSKKYRYIHTYDHWTLIEKKWSYYEGIDSRVMYVGRRFMILDFVSLYPSIMLTPAINMTQIMVRNEQYNKVVKAKSNKNKKSKSKKIYDKKNYYKNDKYKFKNTCKNKSKNKSKNRILKR